MKSFRFGATILVVLLSLAPIGRAVAVPNTPLKTIQNELSAAASQTNLLTPTIPNPYVGAAVLRQNFMGPKTQNWKCNPVRKIATVPMCISGNPKGAKTVVLVGDSQAEMWTPGFDLWGKQHGWRVVLLHKGNCPPWIDRYNYYFDRTAYPECAQFQKFSREFLATMKPTLIVLTGLRPMWPSGTGVRGGPDAPTFANEIKATIARFKPLAKKVIVLPQIPMWTPWASGIVAPDCVIQRSTQVNTCSALVTSNVNDPIVTTALKNGTAAAGVTLLQTNQLLCTPTLCPMVSGKYLMYVDMGHLSRDYVIHIEPAIAQLLVPVVAGL